MTAEEYGLIACLILLALFAFIVLRGLSKASQQPDGYIRLATAGLVMLFGFQAIINMAVNVGLLPAKGMTLPFISYGGSSLLAMALTMGFALGLTRKRPMTGRLKRDADARSAQNRACQGAAGLSERPILLAAGGTGGHLFPAASLAQELNRRGYRSSSSPISAPRNTPSSFPPAPFIACRRRRSRAQSPFAVAATFSRLGIGYFGALNLLSRSPPRRDRLRRLPHAAADHRRAQLEHPDRHSRAERGDGPRQPAALAFRRHGAVLHADPAARPHAESQSRVTGTPVRDAVLAYRDALCSRRTRGRRLLILVFGGSQGARFFSEIMPQALVVAARPMSRNRLTLVQQCREEDLYEVRAAYKKAGIAAHLAPFFRDLPERIAKAISSSPAPALRPWPS